MRFTPLLQVQFLKNASPVCKSTCKSTTQNRPFWTQKREPESSPNTHKLPPKSIQAYDVVPTRPKHPKKWRSKPLFLLGRYITHPATRNKRRLLNYSAFRHYRTISTKPCMQQIAPGCANLFSRQYGVYRRDGAEIEVFSSFMLAHHQVNVYYFCHISIVLSPTSGATHRKAHRPHYRLQIYQIIVIWNKIAS